MAVVALPESLSFASMSWTLHRNDVGYRSVFGAQALEVSAPQWMVTVESGPLRESEAGAWKSLMLQLRGSIDQLALWDHARPAPLGTLRGALVLGAAVSQGDDTLMIRAGADQYGKTLKAGDWLGLGSGLTQQLFMVVADMQIESDPDLRSLALDFTTETYQIGYPGAAEVSVQPPARAAHAAGAAVVWDKPRALFRRLEPNAGWSNESVMTSGFTLNLIEDVRP